MSQYPHDEFDDIPPYKSDEVGKHRSPGAVARASTPGGGLKWIALLTVFVLFVGLLAYFVFPLLRGEDESAADQDASDADVIEDDDAQTDPDNGDGDGSDAEESESNGEESAEDEGEPAAETDFSVTVYNYNAPEGAARSLTSQLEEGGYNVAIPQNWDASWGDITTPVVIYPGSDQQNQAQQIADELGAETMENSAWSSIAVVVGPEGAP